MDHPDPRRPGPNKTFGQAETCPKVFLMASPLFVPYSSKAVAGSGKRLGRPRSVDREGAIQSAMANYWEFGVTGLSLNEVCRRTGLSKPALYREFGGVDGLMAAALDHYRTVRIEPMLAPLGEDMPFATMIEGSVVGLTTDRDDPPGCMLAKMRHATAHLGPLALAQVHDLEQLQWDAYEAFVRRAQQRGEARMDVDPPLASRYIDTQLTTVLMQRSAGLEVELIRAQARIALRALLA